MPYVSDSTVARTGPRDVEHTEDRLLTAGEVSRMLRIGVKKVYSLPLPQVRLSARRVRFLSSDVRAFVQRRRVGAP